MNAIPETAPRGKAFAVQHASHVVDSPEFPVTTVTGAGRYAALLAAEASSSYIDYRLNPTIVLVDKEK